MSNIRLSESRIKALKSGKSAYDICGSDLKGFGIRVLPSGSKRFFVHNQHEGRSIWKTIGDSGSIGLDEARPRATAFLAAIRREDEMSALPEDRLFEAVAEEVFDRYGRNCAPIPGGQPDVSPQEDPSMVRRTKHRLPLPACCGSKQPLSFR